MMSKKFSLYLSLILLAIACKDKDKNPTPQPADKSAEFEILVPSSGFKTLWTFQPHYVAPLLSGGILVKDYTVNTQTNKLHMLVSVLQYANGNPWSVERVTANLTNNTELIEKIYDSDKSQLGDPLTTVQFQPFVNNLFWWGTPQSSLGNIYNNDIETWLGSGSMGALDNPRIDRNGKLVRHQIKIVPDFPPGKWSGYSFINSLTTIVFDQPKTVEEFLYAVKEPINDTTDYYLSTIAKDNTINALKLYKTSMRFAAQGTEGESKLLNTTNLNIDLNNKEIAYKIHYTSDPNIITFGMIIKAPNQLGTKFYSFIWNKQTETITKVLDGVAASTSVTANYVIFDLDDNGNIYYAHTSNIVNPPDAIFKATTAGVSQIGKTNFFRKDISNGYTTIENIKIFNNKPYILIVYYNSLGQYANKENDVNSQLSIVIPE